MTADRPFRTIDWDRMPDYVEHAHRLRSVEARRLIRQALSGLAGLVRRLIAPGGGRRPLSSGPAPSSP